MYASIAAQRNSAPVYWYEPPGYPTGLWVLSKWEHQRYVGSHPDLFCSGYGFAIGDASDPSTVVHTLPDWAQHALRDGNPSPAETRRIISRGKLSMGDPDFESLILADPPRHGQIRNILMKALRPSLVRSLKSRIAEITDEFLDEIEPGAETDFVTTVGRIPAALMTELIGVPREMRDRFIEMASAQMVAITIDPNREPAEVERVQRLVEEFHAYCDALLAERRSSRRRWRGPRQHHRPVGARRWTGAPRHGDLVHPHLRQRRRDEQGAPVVRGHGARRASRPAAPASSSGRSCSRTPSRRRCATTHSTGPGCRTATQDLELGGQLIHADDYVMMAYASANRDEDVWDRPDEFDVTRSFDKDHESFGYGEHSCPGALLARTDSTIIFERLLAFPDWELAGVRSAGRTRSSRAWARCR